MSCVDYNDMDYGMSRHWKCLYNRFKEYILVESIHHYSDAISRFLVDDGRRIKRNPNRGQ